MVVLAEFSNRTLLFQDMLWSVKNGFDRLNTVWLDRNSPYNDVIIIIGFIYASKSLLQYMPSTDKGLKWFYTRFIKSRVVFQHIDLQHFSKYLHGYPLQVFLTIFNIFETRITLGDKCSFRTECTKVWSCSTRYVITNGSPRRVLFYSSTKKIYSKRKSQNRLLPSVSQTIQVNSDHRLRNDCVIVKVNSENF